MRLIATVLLTTLVACGGGAAPPSGVDPAAGPTQAVQDFMQAVADSNLNRMAHLWGTSNGSAAETGKPADYQRRIAVMYTYLRGSTTKVLAEVEHQSNKSTLAVEVDRADCRKRIPWTLERTKDGHWLVTSIELGSLGTPGRPCPPEEQKPPG